MQKTLDNIHKEAKRRCALEKTKNIIITSSFSSCSLLYVQKNLDNTHKLAKRCLAKKEVSFGFLFLYSFTSLCAITFARNKFHAYGAAYHLIIENAHSA